MTLENSPISVSGVQYVIHVTSASCPHLWPQIQNNCSNSELDTPQSPAHKKVQQQSHLVSHRLNKVFCILHLEYWTVWRSVSINGSTLNVENLWNQREEALELRVGKLHGHKVINVVCDKVSDVCQLHDELSEEDFVLGVVDFGQGLQRLNHGPLDLFNIFPALDFWPIWLTRNWKEYHYL